MLFTRSGREWTEQVHQTDKGKPYGIETYPCGRCGGAGGFQHWPGFICYECGGKNSRAYKTARLNLYTQEQNAKLDAKLIVSRAKIQAKKTAVVETKLAGAISQMPAKVRAAYDWALQSENGIALDIARKVAEFGSLTEKQEAFLVKLHAQSLEPIPVVAECPSGRLTITGELVSSKLVHSRFGAVTKILVKADEGFKVWGSYPAGLDGAGKGARVTFTATVEPSEDDRHFGFFSRPTNAEALYA